jgi:CRP/FNR family cyclic AMP-dependent transcriptional regulator
MEKVETLLAQHRFFQDMPSRLLQTVAQGAGQVEFEAGVRIYHEGGEANQFLLIQTGKVAIEIHAHQRGTITIQTVGAGDVLGWSWLFAPYIRRFDARAVERTRAIALDGKFLREKAEEDHELGYQLLKRFSRVVVERLGATTLQLLDIYGHGQHR